MQLRKSKQVRALEDSFEDKSKLPDALKFEEKFIVDLIKTRLDSIPRTKKPSSCTDLRNFQVKIAKTSSTQLKKNTITKNLSLVRASPEDSTTSIHLMNLKGQRDVLSNNYIQSILKTKLKLSSSKLIHQGADTKLRSIESVSHETNSEAKHKQDEDKMFSEMGLLTELDHNKFIGDRHDKEINLRINHGKSKSLDKDAEPDSSVFKGKIRSSLQLNDRTMIKGIKLVYDSLSDDEMIYSSGYAIDPNNYTLV